MATEQYANNSESILSVGISNTDLSLTVADGATFPSAGDFRILIEDEILKVTARSTNTLTVVRAQEGTTAVAHSGGVAVVQVLTRDSLLRVSSRIHTLSTYAGIPAASNEGGLVLLSNGVTIERDNGTGYTQFGPIWNIPRPPAVASWTAVNTGGATLTETAGVLRLNAPATSGNQRRIWHRAAPSPPYIITAMMIPEIHAAEFNMIGLGWREASSGKIMYATLYYVSGGSPGLRISSARAANETGGQTEYATHDNLLQRGAVWYQLEDDNTNRIIRYSQNGVNFITLHTRARTDFDGGAAVSPDQNFIFCDAINATFYVANTIFSWAVS